MENIINKIIELNSDIFGNIINVNKINVGFTNTIYDVNTKFIIKICTNLNNEECFKRDFKYQRVFIGGAVNYILNSKFCGTKDRSSWQFHGKYIK